MGSLRLYQPLYGFASKDKSRFKRAAGHKDLFYIDDKDVEFKQVCNSFVFTEFYLFIFSLYGFGLIFFLNPASLCR